MKKRIMLIADKHNENLINLFLDFYDYKYWLLKLKYLKAMISKPVKTISFLNDVEIKKEGKEKFLSHLKSESFFTFHHLFETFFSLVYSFYVNLHDSKINPWFVLTKYEPYELYEFIDKIESKKIKLSDELILALFFFGISKKDAKRKDIKKSVSFIRDFLIRLIGEVKTRKSYNAHKHGKRCMFVNSNVSLIPDDKKIKPSFIGSAESHMFLSTKEVGRDKKNIFFRISHISEGFDYKKAYRISKVMYKLISNMIESRRQFRDKKGKAKLALFHKENIKRIFKHDKKQNLINFKIDFPTSNPIKP